MATGNGQRIVEIEVCATRVNLPTRTLPNGCYTVHAGHSRDLRTKHAGWTLASKCKPEWRVGIVTGENCRSADRQGRDDCAVFLGYCLDGVHELKMLALGIVDQGYGGLCHGGQDCNFTRVVHAQLNNR